MAISLEIEFLTVVSRGARAPGDDEPDWPPQPDRVFSALVSAWGARGERDDERAALEWLEAQPPPEIYASPATSRTNPVVQVPSNDSTMPSERRRHTRRFPVVCPDVPQIALAWNDAEPASNVFNSLNAIASGVGYLGQSASLTRFWFLRCAAPKRNGLPRHAARRRIYPGRLRELERAHRANPLRPKLRPGAPVVAPPTTPVYAADDWLVLEALDDETIAIQDSALVCQLLRRTLMSGYRELGVGHRIPEVVSGHTADGAPARCAALAVVPLARAGFPTADGGVRGFALVPPRATSLDEIECFRAAFERVAPYRVHEARRVLTLLRVPLNRPLHLTPAADGGSRASPLSSRPYREPSRVWASATPIVLDRHLKRRGPAEIRELIACACVHAGVPRPELDRIQYGANSAVEGVPPTRRLSGETSCTPWQVRPSLQTRSLVHAVIDFGQTVSGPILLGAGRFTGLGLCRGFRKW